MLSLSDSGGSFSSEVSDGCRWWPSSLGSFLIIGVIIIAVVISPIIYIVII
jgi:hypothetical protein